MLRRPAFAPPAGRSAAVASTTAVVLLATLLGSCGDIHGADPSPRALDPAVTEAVQGTVSPDDPRLPMLVSDVQVAPSVPPTAFEVDIGEDVHVPVRATWRIPGVDTAAREATDVVTLQRQRDGWTRISPTRLPWGVSDPVAVTSSRCRVVGSSDVSALVTAVHAACVRSLPEVLDVWPHWDGASVIVITTSPLGRGTGALVEGAVTDGRPAPADRMVVDSRVVADLSEEGLDVVIRHELVHVAMRSTGSAPVPLWFQEGLAVHVGYAGVADGRSAQLEEFRDLYGLRESGRWRGSVPAATRFEDPVLRGHAYVAARLGVEVLMDAVGADRLLNVVAGDEPDVAGPADSPPMTDEDRTRWLLTTLDRSSDWLDREWAMELARRVDGPRPSP